MSCAECVAIDRKFDLRVAQSELERFHRRGPDPTTALMLDGLGAYDLAGATLLDVGGCSR